MARRIAAGVAAVALLAAVGMTPANAASNGPHPKPPKCVPASTPGCS
jgi:hypothetical protein